MNHCLNFTNNLYLKPIIYPNDDKITYFISQDEVNKVINTGQKPIFILENYEVSVDVPKIAVLLTRDKHPDRELVDYSMPISTIEAITLCGGRPYFVCFEMVKEQLEDIKPDGILLPGGDFAFPSEWTIGESAHPKEEIRTQAYIDCLNYAKEHKLPLLGICAGMQMLAGFCEAKITQVSNHRGKIKDFAHTIKINNKSLLSSIIGKKECWVNTNHSEAVAINSLGGCKVSAMAPDGVVEAIEIENSWHKFVIGIQSHPEYFVKSKDEFAIRLFSAFMEACKDESKSY